MHPGSVLWQKQLHRSRWKARRREGRTGEGEGGAVSRSGSEVMRRTKKTKQDASEKEMESAVTVSGSCGKRKLLPVGGKTQANDSMEETEPRELSGDAKKVHRLNKNSRNAEQNAIFLPSSSEKDWSSLLIVTEVYIFSHKQKGAFADMNMRNLLSRCQSLWIQHPIHLHRCRLH